MFRYALAVAALVLSVPVTGQPPWQPPRTPDGHPDMQGIWRFGPGQASLAALVSLEGERGPLWQDVSAWLQVEATISDFKVLAPSFVVDPPDGKIPYQPWTAAKRREFFANSVTPTKLEHIDPNTRGWLTGVPRIQHYPPPLQILQVPGSVVLLYENKHASRVVPLDGRSHVGENIHLFMGDSRGRWEGNTLVVDVTNQNGRAWLDVLSFHGEGLHVVERWTPVGPDRIDYQATFEDATMFTQPWTIAYSFTRANLASEIWEAADYEGERDIERMLRGGGFAGRRKE